MEQIDICAGSGQAAAQGVLQHIAGTAGILANDDLGPFALLFAIIPSEKTSYLERMFNGQRHIRLTTETVCTEISTHIRTSFLI